MDYLLYGAEDDDSIPWLAETLVGIKFDAIDDDSEKRFAAIKSALNILTAYEDEPTTHRTFQEGSVVYALMPALKEFIQYKDASVLEVVLDAIHYLMDVGPEERQLFIDDGIIRTAFTYLDHDEPKVKVAALGVVANILFEASEEERQLLMGSGIIKTALSYLDHGELTVKVAALMVLTVFIAGSLDCLQYSLECNALKSIAECLMHPHNNVYGIALKNVPYFFTCLDNVEVRLDDDIIQSFIHLFGKDDAVKAKALIVLVQIITFGKSNYASSLIDKNVISAVFKCLDSDQNCVIGPALTLLKRTLDKSGNQVGKFCQMIEDCGGIDEFKKHQNHADKNVVAAANALIESLLSAKLNSGASIN